MLCSRRLYDGVGAPQLLYAAAECELGTRRLYDGFMDTQLLHAAARAHLGSVGRADCGRGSGEGHFKAPSGLCVVEDTLYVCDKFNDRIVVLGTDLSWRYTFGSYGSTDLSWRYTFGREGSDGEFDWPMAVAAHGIRKVLERIVREDAMWLRLTAIGVGVRRHQQRLQAASL